MAIDALAARVADTPFADWAAGSSWAYPAANVLHLGGLVLLLGGIGLVDLRLLGALRRLPLDALARTLTPLAAAGFLILAASGAVLFAADPAVADSGTFRRKLVLIGIALVNAAAFRVSYGDASFANPVPFPARLMAAASLALWLLVAVSGRMIAYS